MERTDSTRAVETGTLQETIPTIVATPLAEASAQEDTKETREKGKAGRKSTELKHAVNWLLWEKAGFAKDRCPWRNPYECKKHKPPEENLIEARHILGWN